jgi:putative flippase GtrA
MIGSYVAELAAQFVKFGIVGFANTFISLFVYYVFIFIDERLYAAGWAVGFVAGVLNAYYWNRRFVFGSGGSARLAEAAKAFLAYGFTSALGFLIIYAHVNYFGFSEKTAPLFALSITVPLNFALNKMWTFRDGRAHDNQDLEAPPPAQNPHKGTKST